MSVGVDVGGSRWMQGTVFSARWGGCEVSFWGALGC